MTDTHAVPMTWDEIREALEFARQPFPYDAMHAAIAQRESVAPHLLAEIERLAADSTPARNGDFFLHLFAICLLAQFRDTRAYRPLVALATQPGEREEELFDDFTTECLGRALATVCDGNLQPLRDLAENPEISVWIRGAAIEALAVRALEGDASPEEIVAYLELLGNREADRARGLPPDDRDDIWMGTLVNFLCDLGPDAALESIRRWFAEDLLDPSDIRLADVENELGRPFEGRVAEMRDRGRGYLRDAIAELEGWACFDEDQDSGDPDAHRRPPDFSPAGTLPYIREGPKVGRNEPCPCGSGRKYKKCCGANA